jgi:hypothetical protein
MPEPTPTYEQQRDSRKAEAKASLLTLAEPIKAAGYRYLVAYFDGSGDTGQIGTIILRYDEEGNGEATADARYEGDLDGGDELPAAITAILSAQAIEDAIWPLARS